MLTRRTIGISGPTSPRAFSSAQVRDFSFSAPEHDPEKWAPVFPRDKRLSVCAEIMLQLEISETEPHVRKAAKVRRIRLFETPVPAADGIPDASRPAPARAGNPERMEQNRPLRALA